MKLSYIAASLAFTASAWAQTEPNPFEPKPLGYVEEFLQLSEAQVQTLLTNNDEYNWWASEKRIRIQQVQVEIGEETAKDPLDPSALGIRYAEIESICREMKVRAKEFRGRNLTALTQNQKTKLTVLEEAIKLAEVVSEAQDGNLIGELSSAPSAFNSRSTGMMTRVLIGGTISAVIGCNPPFSTYRDPFPGNIIPANRVSGTVPQTATRTVNRWFDRTRAEQESHR